jgi:undecaprenyl-diphosphatase
VEKKESKQEWMVFLIGFTGFMVISALMVNGKLAVLDFLLQTGVLSLRNNGLTAFFVPLSYSGNWQVVVPLCLVLLIIKKTRTGYGVPLTLAALTSVTFYQILKHLFSRVRPDQSLHLLEQGGYSFPSGHSLTSFLVWGMLALLLIYYQSTDGAPLPFYKKKTGAVPYIKSVPHLRFSNLLIFTYIALMGFSRIYVGVHWPSDVLCSWFLATAVLVVLKKIIWRERQRIV